eukprot:g3520.t1
MVLGHLVKAVAVGAVAGAAVGTAQGLVSKETQPITKEQIASTVAFLEKESVIFKAAELGLSERLRVLAAKGCDLNSPRQKRGTVACVAAANGHAETLRVLVQLGVNVNQPEPGENRTPASFAAAGGHVDALRALHELGCKCDIPDKDGWTPARFAAAKNHTGVLLYLHELGCNVSGVVARTAAIHGSVEALRALAKQMGVNVGEADAKGIASMHAAAHQGKTEAVRALAALGVNVNHTDGSGQTPLSHAAENNHPDTVRALHELGAGLESAKDTAMNKAASNGHMNMLRLLKELGADVNGCDAAGRTPVSFAADSGFIDAVRALHAMGANIDTADKAGNTPAHYACSWVTSAPLIDFQLETLGTLHALGANMFAANSAGFTPLHVAMALGQRGQAIISAYMRFGDCAAASEVPPADLVGHRILVNGLGFGTVQGPFKKGGVLGMGASKHSVVLDNGSTRKLVLYRHKNGGRAFMLKDDCPAPTQPWRPFASMVESDGSYEDHEETEENVAANKGKSNMKRGKKRARAGAAVLSASSSTSTIHRALRKLFGNADTALSQEQIEKLRGALDCAAKVMTESRVKRVKSMAAEHNKTLSIDIRGVELPLNVCTDVLVQYIDVRHRGRLAQVSRDWRSVCNMPASWPSFQAYRMGIQKLQQVLVQPRFNQVRAIKIPKMKLPKTLWKRLFQWCPGLRVIDAGVISGFDQDSADALIKAAPSPLSIIALQLPEVAWKCTSGVVAPILRSFKALKALGLRSYQIDSAGLGIVLGNLDDENQLEDFSVVGWNRAGYNRMLRSPDLQQQKWWDNRVISAVGKLRQLRRLEVKNVLLEMPEAWKSLCESAPQLDTVTFDFSAVYEAFRVLHLNPGAGAGASAGASASTEAVFWPEGERIVSEILAMPSLLSFTFRGYGSVWLSKKQKRNMRWVPKHKHLRDFMGYQPLLLLLEWAGSEDVDNRELHCGNLMKLVDESQSESPYDFNGYSPEVKAQVDADALARTLERAKKYSGSSGSYFRYNPQFFNRYQNAA